MKKVLSVLLITVMIFTLVVMPMGVNVAAATNSNGGAFDNINTTAKDMPSLPNKGVVNYATGATPVSELVKPTYDEATIGNYMAGYTAEQRAEHLAQINADLAEVHPEKQYIPVVESKRDGVTPANAVLFSEIEDDGFYYLWENITWTQWIESDKSGSTEEDCSKFDEISGGNSNENPKTYVDDVVIDGCGYTLTMGENCSYLFNKCYNITLNNLTITRATPIICTAKEHHILARYEMRGYSRAENLTLDVDFEINENTHWNEGLETFAYVLGHESYLINILNTSTININSGVKRANKIAGLVSYTTGDVLIEKVVNRGVININSPVLDSVHDTQQACDEIGGIVGTVYSTDNKYNPNGVTTFRECFNEMSINIKNGSVLGTGAYIGGILGAAKTAVVMENCVSRGAITVGESGNEAYTPMIKGIGGLVGRTVLPISFNNCFNETDIIAKTNVIMGAINVGGIISAAPAGTTFVNCQNEGDIIIGENTGAAYDPKINNIGGIVAYITGDATVELNANSANNTYTFENCFNKGKIHLNVDVFYPDKKDQGITMGIAGIAGATYGSVAFKNCVNQGQILNEGSILKCFAGIAGAGRGTHLAFNNCINFGEIRIFQHGNTDVDSASAGGIMGYQYIKDASVVSFYNCTNNGDVVDTTTTASNPTANEKMIRGGIVAAVRGVKDVKFYNCINNGNVTAAQQDSYGVTGALYEMSHCGGIIGLYGSLGNWMGHYGVDSTFVAERCTNNGHVRGLNCAGGILGTTFELNDGNSNGIVHSMSFIDCLNSGKNGAEIVGGSGKSGQGGNVGGIAGIVSGNTKFSLRMVRCENAATIRNHAVDNPNVGGIIGDFYVSVYSPEFYFDSCENTGVIRGRRNLGGIIGYAGAGSVTKQVDADDYVAGFTIKNCVSNNAIYGGTYAGGIIAYIAGTDSAPTVISDCYNGEKGVVSITVQSVAGGIVGYQDRSNVSLTRCYNMGVQKTESNNAGCYLGGIVARMVAATTLTECHNYADFSYASDAYYSTLDNSENKPKFGGIGGVVASIEKAVTVNLTDCSNSGKMTLGYGAVNSCIGGVVGNAFNGATITLTRCANYGNITAKATMPSALPVGVGGILGTAGRTYAASTVTLKGCTNAANVTLESQSTHYSVGGLLGILANGSVTLDKSDDNVVCANTGVITAAGTDVVGLGGVIGATKGDTSKVTIKNTINKGTVELLPAGKANAVGGVLGYSADSDITITYTCNEGDVIDSSDHAREAQFGLGGIVGEWMSNNSTKNTMTMSYCENKANVTAAKNYSWVCEGGIIGVILGHNCQPTLKYCINGGQISGGQYVAGILGFLRTNEAPTDFKASFDSMTNSGNVMSPNACAAGVIGYVSVYGDTNKTISIDMKNCMNIANIGGGTYGGGLVGSHISGKTIKYTIANCIIKGYITGEKCATLVADSNSLGSESTISGCIIGSKLPSSTGSVYTLAPAGFTVRNCSVIANAGGSNSYSVTTLLDEAALNTALDAIKNTETNVTGVRIFERENIRNMYLLAAEVVDTTPYGNEAGDFKTQRDNAKKYGAFPLDTEGTDYFTATQKTSDQVYMKLYNWMYVFDSEVFTIYIPDSIMLEEQQLISVDVGNFSGASEFYVNVSGDFTLTNVSEPDTYVKYYIETDEGVILEDDGRLLTIDDKNYTKKNHYFTPKVNRDASVAVPGTYRGSITFSIQYEMNGQ